MTIWRKSLAVVLAAILLLAGCATDTEPADNKPTKTTVTTTSPVTTANDTDNTDPSQTTTTGSSTTSTTSNPSANKPTTTGTKPTTRTTTTTHTPKPTIGCIMPSTPSGTVKVAGMAGCCFDLDKNANAINKRVVEELDSFYQHHSIKFKLSLYDSASLTEECIKADKAGTVFADLVVTNVWQQRPLVKAGVLANLNEVGGWIGKLDLTDSRMDQAAHRDMQICGKNYIAFTKLFGTPYSTNVIYFNKTLAKSALQKLGYEVETPEDAGKILYKMVDDGKWTFDQMQKLSQKASADLTGDGKIDDRTAKDQYGFAGVDVRNSVSYSIFKSKGGYFTKKDSKGNITFALDDAINMTALKTMQTWLHKDTSVYNADKYGNSQTISADAFLAGRVLFLGWSADKANELSEMRQDWGLLPYPKSESSASYNGAVSWNMQGFSIPRKVQGDDLRRAAIAIEDLSYIFDDLAKEKETYLQKRVFRDTDSLRMLQLAASTATVDPVQFVDLGSGGMSTIHYVFDSTSNDPAYRVKSVRDEAVKALNDFLTAVK